MRRILALALLISSLPGCAVAPLSTHITARSNGKSESLASVGSTLPIKDSGALPSLKYSIGVSDDIDLGFQYEVIEYGAWMKYSFVNRQEGFSAAGLFGVGLSFEGFYSYIGPIVSWKIDWFEPYLTTRYNYVSNALGRVDIATTGEFRVQPGVYRYFQHTAGFLTWPIDWFGIGLEASYINPISSDFILEGKNRFLLSGNFSFRF
jgi:hypothetical protein